jgi:DNA polymerase-3 subunit alpha
MASWALGITNVNPKKHGTMFERFLNPNRTSKPDIDIDFGAETVDLVEAFVKVRYGKDCVIDIIAHSTFGPRAALTDVGRVLSIPYDHVKAATKTIDDKQRGKLEDIRLTNKAVDRYAEDHPEAWEISKLVQGQVARKSEHAAGLLILPENSGDMPVERQGGQKGKLLSAYGERSGKGNALISDYGYNKLDVLRVAELDKQQYAVDLIYESTGKRIDLDALPVHDDPYATDPAVMQKFADGQFVGVFQWSGVAGTMTRKAKPKTILDLSAINALIRPGAAGANLDAQWVRRMRGEEEVTYWHPVLEPYLGYTKGVLTFQEQLIEVAHHLGGLSRGDADLMRRIASKYYRDPAYARQQMGTMFDALREGMLAKGLSDEEIIVILDTLISFSDYSFNLAHSDGYSLLAYRDMWLKTYYPRQFYAAFLSKGLSKVTKKRIVQKQEAAREARMNGLKIMPPDVNESGRDYTVVIDGIRLGLEAIKHIGPASASIIEEYRPFESYEEFERRCPSKLNITGRAALIMSGACDRWRKRDGFTEERIDELERELLGMSLTSTYSIAQYQPLIDGKFWTEDEVDAADEGTPVAVAGEVAGVKEILDKNGNVMAFIDLVYGPNHYDCTVFSYLYDEFKPLLQSRRPILVTGEKNTHNGRVGVKVKGLPPDADGEQTPPLMDFQDYVEMLGDQEEQLMEDSVFPEDLAEQFENALAADA